MLKEEVVQHQTTNSPLWVRVGADFSSLHRFSQLSLGALNSP